MARNWISTMYKRNQKTRSFASSLWKPHLYSYQLPACYNRMEDNRLPVLCNKTLRSVIEGGNGWRTPFDAGELLLRLKMVVHRDSNRIYACLLEVRIQFRTKKKEGLVLYFEEFWRVFQFSLCIIRVLFQIIMNNLYNRCCYKMYKYSWPRVFLRVYSQKSA